VRGKFVLIDSNTSFKGAIIAEKVIVEGTVEGEINASEHVLLKKGAVVNGPIQTPRFLCEEGSKHKGLIRLDGVIENENNLTSSVSRIEEGSDEQKKEGDPSSSTSTEEGKSSKRLW